MTSLLCALALVVATGCRTASPKPAKPAYGGLMSPRGVVPPANREYQPSAARPSLAPATAGEPLPPAEDDFLVVPDTFDADGLEDAPEAPVAEAPAVAEAAPAKPAPAKRELPHIANGRTPQVNATAPAAATPAAKPAAGENSTYVVKNGDSLSKIAAAHGVKRSEILALNPSVSSPDKIRAGQRLVMPATASGAGLEAAPAAAATSALPADGIYTVKKGESLWTIGKRFGVKRDDIKAWNNLTDDKLKEGQQLRLRADAAQPAKKAVEPPKQQPAPKVQEPKVEEPKVQEPPAAVAAPVVVTEPAPASNLEAPVEPEVLPVQDSGSTATSFPLELVEGDTLEKLADEYSVTVESILLHNPQIKSNADLKVGDSIMMFMDTPAAQ
ncbi:MAG: LysM peptidoglycan-binding domain-containing protein [Victivallales bacterium]|nr:LysM peptidoglycan-binding domain-containing protein [Victivallales bacterium]